MTAPKCVLLGNEGVMKCKMTEECPRYDPQHIFMSWGERQSMWKNSKICQRCRYYYDNQIFL